MTNVWIWHIKYHTKKYWNTQKQLIAADAAHRMHDYDVGDDDECLHQKDGDDDDANVLISA